MDITTLDKWDSMIMLLSKGHFSEEKKELNITTVDVLKAIWADRCGIDIKYVETGRILSHIISLLARLNLLTEREVTHLLGDAIDHHNGKWPKYHDTDLSMIDSLIHSVLGIISTVKVKDTIEVDGEKVWENLINYEEKYTSFLEVFREKVDG